MVSGWMCGTAWWQWKSNKALLSGSGGLPGEDKHHGSGRPVQKAREIVREQIV